MDKKPGPVPKPRRGEALVYSNNGGSPVLVALGGRTTDQEGYFDSMWIFHLGNKTWEEVAAPRDAKRAWPGARDHLGAVNMDGAVYMHGGRGGKSYLKSEPLGDLWRFDISARHWEQLTTSPVAFGDRGVPDADADIHGTGDGISDASDDVYDAGDGPCDDFSDCSGPGAGEGPGSEGCQHGGEAGVAWAAGLHAPTMTGPCQRRSSRVDAPLPRFLSGYAVSGAGRHTVLTVFGGETLGPPPREDDLGAPWQQSLEAYDAAETAGYYVSDADESYDQDPSVEHYGDYYDSYGGGVGLAWGLDGAAQQQQQQQVRGINGSFSGCYLNDVWQYNLRKGRWRQLSGPDFCSKRCRRFWKAGGPR